MTGGYDNFIGWSQAEKISMLRALQEARLTGQVVRADVSRGVGTEFNVTQTHINQNIRELEFSIASDPSFDPKDPIQAACAANIRPGQTAAVFW